MRAGQDRFERLTEQRRLREQVDTGKLKAGANTAVSIARDMAKNTNSPLVFYAEAGNLISQLGRLFEEANNRKLAKVLKTISVQVGKYGEAFRHGDSWESA